MKIGLQVPVFSWEGGPGAIGGTLAQTARTDFLAGLVSTEAGMIALIDLPHLLTDSVEHQLDSMSHLAAPAVVAPDDSAFIGQSNLNPS